MTRSYSEKVFDQTRKEFRCEVYEGKSCLCSIVAVIKDFEVISMSAQSFRAGCLLPSEFRLFNIRLQNYLAGLVSVDSLNYVSEALF